MNTWKRKTLSVLTRSYEQLVSPHFKHLVTTCWVCSLQVHLRPPLLSIDSHVLYFFCCFLFPLFLSFCLGGLERICGTSLSVTNLIKTNGSDSSSFISQRIPDFGSWTHHRNGSPVLSLHDRIMKRFMLHNFPQCQIIILFRSSVKAAVINCSYEAEGCSCVLLGKIWEYGNPTEASKLNLDGLIYV